MLENRLDFRISEAARDQVTSLAVKEERTLAEMARRLLALATKYYDVLRQMEEKSDDK